MNCFYCGVRCKIRSKSVRKMEVFSLLVINFVLTIDVIATNNIKGKPCPIGLIEKSVCKSSFTQLNCQHREEVDEDGCETKRLCRCPENEPLYENGKCIEAYECPEPESDGTSTLPTGHNFIVAGNVEPSGLVTGMHISGLKLPPHWYHAVVRFQIENHQCARTVRTTKESSGSQPFLSIRFSEEAVKLVDLIQSKDPINAQFAFGTGPFFKLITTCKVRVESVIDLRRYGSSEAHPQFARYIIFEAGKDVYISRIAKRCKDIQQLIKVKVGLQQQTLLKKIKNGVQITIPVLPGKPEIDSASGSLIDSLQPEVIVEGLYKDTKGSDLRFPIVVESVVITDSFIINLFCQA